MNFLELERCFVYVAFNFLPADGGVSEARYQTDLGLGLMPFKVDCKVKKGRYRSIAFKGYLGLIGLGAWMFRREMSSKVLHAWNPQ